LAQVVVCLSSKPEALSSTHSTNKKKIKKKSLREKIRVLWHVSKDLPSGLTKWFSDFPAEQIYWKRLLNHLPGEGGRGVTMYVTLALLEGRAA
jgi:hypothetical protein